MQKVAEWSEMPSTDKAAHGIFQTLFRNGDPHHILDCMPEEEYRPLEAPADVPHNIHSSADQQHQSHCCDLF